MNKSFALREMQDKQKDKKAKLKPNGISTCWYLKDKQLLFKKYIFKNKTKATTCSIRLCKNRIIHKSILGNSSFKYLMAKQDLAGVAS